MKYFIKQKHLGGWEKLNLSPQSFVSETAKLVPAFGMDTNLDTIRFLISLLNESGYNAGEMT